MIQINTRILKILENYNEYLHIFGNLNPNTSRKSLQGFLDETINKPLKIEDIQVHESLGSFSTDYVLIFKESVFYFSEETEKEAESKVKNILSLEGINVKKVDFKNEKLIP